MFEKILENVRAKTPLVHCITNYVTVNDCANILLACGGSPIMADDIEEVEEIVSICNALVINIGTLNQRTVLSMLKAGKKANQLGLPVILDPVGAGASALRTATAFKLLEEVRFTVIRGNISEIKALAQKSGGARGVDAASSDALSEDTLNDAAALARALSQDSAAVIAISGPVDIVSDQEKTYLVRNGHPMMSRITGSGCMLGCLMGAYSGANPACPTEAAAAATAALGLCGELAYLKVQKEDGGASSFRTYLIDHMSKLDPETLNGGLKIETR